MANENLKNAKKNKNDEFYTQLSDIEKELKHYKSQLKDKIIFLNCDDPEWSNFWKCFKLNFEFLGLKKLISTHFEEDKPSYKLEYDGKNILETPLKQNGDFRSPESIELLKEADIVVTNPPFSLFREYVAQLMEYDKKFLIIGSQNAITYKEIFTLLKENKIWLGYRSGGFIFRVPKSYTTGNLEVDENGKKYAKLGNIAWFTNLDTVKRHEELIFYKQYTPEEYPRYDNYDAINVDKVSEIPMDYFGPMGVPITFMDKYNPEQFRIEALGIVGSCEFKSNKKMEILKNGEPTGKYTHNAKGTLYRKFNPKTDKKPAFKDANTGELYSSMYARVIVKRKDVQNNEN